MTRHKSPGNLEMNVTLSKQSIAPAMTAKLKPRQNAQKMQKFTKKTDPKTSRLALVEKKMQNTK